jgi:uncharacterized protein
MSSSSESVIAQSEVRFLRSEIIGDEFKLFIAHPVVPVAPGQKVPVIYALDANGAFGTVTETARLLQMTGDVPNAYVIGIGYRKGSLIDTLAIRSRDYTPVESASFNQNYPKIMGLKEPVTTGGAPAFLRFVREELRPYVESEFAADPSDATISGASFGGLFPTYVLLNQPDTFQRYIICSPSLLYEYDLMFRQETAYAEGHQDLAARVFLTCGALENEQEGLAQLEKLPPEMVSAVREVWGGRMQMVELLHPFAEQLRSRRYPNLELTVHVFPEEHHHSVYPAAVSRGLRVVFSNDFKCL